MDDNWNAFDSAVPDEVIAQEGLGDPTRTEKPNELDVARRRLKSCLAKWPFAESGHYHPNCCRFPKSCSPYAHPEQVAAGNVTDDDLEVL